MTAPTFTPADVALLQRTIATLRAAELMADAIPALADLHDRVAVAVPTEREITIAPTVERPA